MIQTREEMRSMLAGLAENANRDSMGKIVNKPRRWPMPCFVCEISKGLEVCVKPDGIDLPGNSGNDRSQCVGIGLKHFIVGESRRHWPVSLCNDEGHES